MDRETRAKRQTVRGDVLENALADIARLAASEKGTRDPYGTLESISRMAWQAIDEGAAHDD